MANVSLLAYFHAATQRHNLDDKNTALHRTILCDDCDGKVNSLILFYSYTVR